MMCQRRILHGMVVIGSLSLLSGAVLAQNKTVQEKRGVARQSTGSARIGATPTLSSKASRVTSSTPGVTSVSTRPSRTTNSGPVYRPTSSRSTSSPYYYSRYVGNRGSFRNFGMFHRSLSLFDLLRANYGFAFTSLYFDRYYLNNEPILNRQTVYYSLLASVATSIELTRASAEFNQLLAEYQGSQDSMAAARDPRWRPLVKRMRSLAKKIRKDPFLRNIEIRKNSKKATAELKGFKRMAPSEQAARLTHLIRKLQVQMTDMWGNPSPSVVSVDTLAQPSFQALAKGIEGLAKRLEKPSQS